MHTKTTHSVMWIRFLYAYKNHSFRNCEYVSYMHTKTTHSLLWIRFLYAYKNHSFHTKTTIRWCEYVSIYAYVSYMQNHSFLIVNTFLICIQKPLIPYGEYVSYMHTKTTHSVMWIRFLYAYKNHSFRNVNTFLICIQKPLIP